MAKQIGKVTHWYDRIGVAVVKLTGKLSQGDRIVVKKGTDEFEDTVSSIELDHKAVSSAGKGDDAAIKLSRKPKDGAAVCIAD